MSKIPVRCINTGSVMHIEAGLRLAEVATRFGVSLKYTILGARVNNKTMGLGYRVFQPKTIEFFDVTNPEGLRMYIRSLIFILDSAVHDLMPDGRLFVDHSVSKGLYCEVIRNNSSAITDAEIAAIRERMHQIVSANETFVRREVETAEALRLFESCPDKASLLRQHGDMYTTINFLGEHVGMFYGELVPSTGIVDVFDLQPYHGGILMRLPDPNDAFRVAPIVQQDKMFNVFRQFGQWQRLLRISRLSDLNDAIAQGRANSVIAITEALHEKNIANIADQIAARRDEVKIVLIAGPSSSGKTTFGKRLAVQLVVAGIVPVNLSLDNYFVNRTETPLDENGDYDFEALEAVDVELFNNQMLALLRGEEVEIPKFSFETGERYYDGERLRMGDNHVLIIEGNHGLTPQLTHLVPARNKFRIYVSPLAGINFDSLTRINTTDNRLIRRMVRDSKYRGYSAQQTISRWPSVRRGEDKYIYPNQEEADVMFNSALLYEMAVLKSQAEPLLLEVQPNMPEYAEARRLLRFLSYFKPMSGETIPPTSILREFLGGSSFRY